MDLSDLLQTHTLVIDPMSGVILAIVLAMGAKIISMDKDAVRREEKLDAIAEHITNCPASPIRMYGGKNRKLPHIVN